VATAAPLIVADAREHPILQGNLAVRDWKVVAYLGVPLTTPGGQVLGSLCTVDGKPRDWTKREVKILQELAASVMTEIELRVLAHRYQANFIALRKLELQRAELVQMLVHDLRNPLTSLLGGLELVQMLPGLDTDLRDGLAIARQGGEALLRMVNDILDVSKAEAGQMGLDLRDVSPEQVIADASTQISKLAEKAGVALVKEVTAGLPTIEADREKLRRVLVNLLSNAIQHTPSGGKIKVGARPSEDWEAIIFTVADTGYGMPEERLGRIFDKFGQLNSPRSGRVSTGLGLPFCKMAVEAHGGSISVESERDKGSIFQFTIPLRRVAPKGPAAFGAGAEWSI
jgi:signal transduction histidine kinase